MRKVGFKMESVGNKGMQRAGKEGARTKLEM